MHSQILLTGATGALGPALAAELARRGAAERFAVLMRAADVRTAFEPWRDTVASLLPADERHAVGRLFPVAGDICRDNLGLENAGESLRQETDVVIHAAADTNFAAPQERQWDVNVGGTRRMLEWSEKCRNLKRFLLVSSVFVSGSRTGRIDETLSAQRPEFVTHYQRTKWEAEHVALDSGLPVGVARISLVLGSHATGGVHRTGAVHSLIKWFTRGLVPLVPGLPEARGDLIATETAAQCLARAVLADRAHWEDVPEGARGRIWHIAAGDEAPRMMELIDFVYEHFAGLPGGGRRGKRLGRPQMVAHGEFQRFIEAVDAAGRTALAQALRSVNRFLPDLMYPKTYATTRAEALWGGPLPRYDWRETMSKVIRFCCPADA